MRSIWLVGIMVMLILGISVWYLMPIQPPSTESSNHTKKSMDERPQTVSITHISRKNIPIEIQALGTVTPLQQVVVRSRIDGELMSVNFNEGEWVKKGQRLATIDSRLLQSELSQQHAQEKRDQALLNNAKVDLKRYQQLAQDEAISSQQIDTQQALVKQYEANLAGTRALINTTELQLSYCQIHAPISGKVGFRKIDVGNHIRANDADGLVHIAQVDPIAIIFSLPEKQAVMLYRAIQNNHEPWPILIWQKDQQQRLAEGTIISIDNQIDASTGTLTFKAKADNAQQQLIPNQFVRITLTEKTLNHAMTLPKPAVLKREQGDFIYQIQSNHRVIQIPVTVLYSNQDIAVIEWLNHDTAIDETLPVVLEGSDKLRAGSLVKYKENNEQPKDQINKQATTKTMSNTQ